jgi:hypothetical protein
MLDTFLLALYASMVPVAYLQTSWLQHWVNVYHYGAVALFAWVSVPRGPGVFQRPGDLAVAGG